MHEFSNKQLIKLIQAKSNEEAFNELFKRYHGKIRQLLSYKVPPSSIDDLMQEIFITIFTNIDQLKALDKFDPWLNRIVYTKLNDHYRNSYKEEKTSLEQENQILLDTFLVSDSSEDVAITKFKLSDIHDIIVKVPSEKIEAFLLHHLYGISYDEIAAITDEKHSTVRGKIARAKISIFNEIFSKSTSKEIRESISTKISHRVSDRGYLKRYLKADYYQNQELLEAINPKRASIRKPKVYFHQSLDNIMILADINKDILACFIKVKCKTSIPVLLNRISTKKRVHCVFLSTEYIKDAKKYLDFTTGETMNYSFFASPSANIKSPASQSVTESSLGKNIILDYLQERDPKLRRLINTLIKEYGNDPSRYKFFTTTDPITEKISAYAFFLKSDTHLWGLGRYISFDKSSDIPIQSCIAVGTCELLNQNYYVSNTGITETDKVFLEIAPRLGFEVAYRFASGTIKIK